MTSAEREANSEIKHTEEPILYEPVFKPVLRLDQRMMHALILMLSRIWFRVYARWRVIGLEHIPLAGGVLIVANHSSNIDALLGWAAVHRRRRMWGVAKVELWQRPLLRYCMYAIGGIPVHRGVADRTFIRTVLDLLARGEVVGLFPEGTRTLDGKLQPAQPGIALLALKSGVPVVPLALIGTYEMMPPGRSKLHRVPLKAVFGPPIQFPPNARRETVQIAVMEAIAALLTANGQPSVAPPLAQRPSPMD